MEDINTRGSATKTIATKLFQPRLIIQSLAFTGILYFSVGQTPPTPPTGVTSQLIRSSTPLSTSVGNTVLQHASQQSGLPTSELRIVQAQPQTWSDNCLGLRELGTSCTQVPVSGWQVAVASGKQQWVYRTDASGSVIKLERGTSLPTQKHKEVPPTVG
ncbi:MAG: hypothetical protein F6K28_62415 [Microcoleus sp. SIO2G3]|nr:hypothetical protein [Microcoleus sp. SIO2G3]